jgi:hypothetical protein
MHRCTLHDAIHMPLCCAASQDTAHIADSTPRIEKHLIVDQFFIPQSDNLVALGR